jgi:hypothetical protein
LVQRFLVYFISGWYSRVALAGLILAHPVQAQEPLSHIPFCSADSAARAFVDQIRFKVAGTDSASRQAEAASGLAPSPAEDVVLVVDDQVCIAASSAFASNGGSRGMPAPFPVAVVRAGSRYAVRLPESPPNGGDQRTLVFDTNFQPLGRYGTSP